MLYKVENLVKEYLVGSVEVPALRGLNLEIKGNEVIALTGPSGSGKSTLLNILGLLERPTKGMIQFGGVDLASLADTALTSLRREAVGFIFQSFNLIPVLSALENVEYPLYLERHDERKVIRERALAALDSVGLADFAHHKPAQMSGGQRQRVAIARAIVKRPRVVLADEPTANLDSKTSEQVIQLIVDLQRTSGATIIIVTHDQDIARLAQRQIAIKDGRLDQNAG